jgi:hypothetical protein
MIPGSLFGFLPLVLGLVSGQPAIVGATFTSAAMQEELILRIPIFPRPPMPQVEWREHKGPKCIPTNLLERAIVSGAGDEVDFVLGNRVRMRADLDEDCPALDFYNGLYLQTPDDRLCAGRDEIHSRMGGSCRIRRFKQLTPKVR